MKKINYSSLSGDAVINQAELFALKGGFVQEYGCENNVCAIDRSGAKDLCSDAYCRSGVGPSHPIQKEDDCRIWTKL